MPTIAESLGNQSQLNSSLKAGLEVIDRGETVTFLRYDRVVIPLDGFIFWVQSADPTTTVVVSGSLHYATDLRQNEDETIAINRVVFTAEAEVQYFNLIGPDTIYIGSFEEIRFAFSQRQSFYEQAGIYHYVGDAIYPDMESQIINTGDPFDPSSVVVSNSLPIWLSLNGVMTVYPSFAIPNNAAPPYASIHIAPESTAALQSAPYIDQNSSHYQLATEQVRITIYGLRNADALSYQDYVFAYMANNDTLGLMNMPIVRDEKRTQAELAILAQKKSMIFEISYYQQTARDIARQLILSAIPNFFLGA